LTCYFDRQCEINVNNRHICASCRLAKCFKFGMSTNLFRGPNITKSNTKALVKEQVEHQSEQVRLLKRKSNNLIIHFLDTNIKSFTIRYIIIK
jgi:hypothetical protein